MPSKTEEYLALAQRPAGADAGVVTHAVLSDARRNRPAGTVGGGYQKAETADRCGVC